MKNKSTTITTSIVVLIGTLFAIIGIPVGEGELAELMDTILKAVGQLTVIIGAVINWISRYKKGDVKPFGGYVKVNKPNNENK